MQVVLDTNVFISGVFFSGPPYEILAAWRDGRMQIVTSPEILQEYERVADELAKEYPSINISPILDLLAVKADVINAPRLAEPVCEDAEDDKFIACALASKAACIASGDKHLLKVSGYEGMKVLRPRAFVDRYIQREESL